MMNRRDLVNQVVIKGSGLINDAVSTTTGLSIGVSLFFLDPHTK